MKMDKELTSVLFKLVALSVISAIILGAVFIPTQIQLAIYEEEQRQLALKEILPGASTFDPIKSGEETLYYRALDIDNNLIGYAFFKEQSGSQDNIILAGGIDTEYTVTGLKIMKHKETPGLGARIVDSAFTDQFKGVAVSDLSLSKKGGAIDAITGASVSSQAVIDGMHAKIGEIKEKER